jgi:hypothetical protein
MSGRRRLVVSHSAKPHYVRPFGSPGLGRPRWSTSSRTDDGKQLGTTGYALDVQRQSFRRSMPTIGRAVLEGAGSLISLGGLYDVLVPRLPGNLTAMCGGDARSSKLVRELLRALGGALVGIGVAVMILASGFDRESRERTTVLILILVLPSEGINTLGMLRVGSPYYVPLALIVLTLAGLAVSWSTL